MTSPTRIRDVVNAVVIFGSLALFLNCLGGTLHAPDKVPQGALYQGEG